MALSTRLLTLRRSPLLLRLPPYLSAICILVGIAWLLILPLDEYSRQTYVSENAILPGQVHTYFGGSEHNVFRAYRQEVFVLSGRPRDERLAGLQRILREGGLKAASQTYAWTVGREEIAGTNVYGLLQGPRADATEAMVLIAAWRNFEGSINFSGVALALTLARYFQRWSIWSKDILVLIPEDSVYGPEAWVSAYHSTSAVATSVRNVSALPIKAGALQGAVALDYPAGPWGKRYDKLDILYDGINGALPNLDLLNTAVSIANGQIGIGCSLHGMPDHRDGYVDRLVTLAKGLMTQSAGHATGPHSAFMPYHVDAITLKTVGDGWHDEISLGRTTESLFRSINNLLEHLHQSFFFYILLNTNRFVSIGNYLPAAMILAGSFTITALALWVQSGRSVPGGGEAKPGSSGRAAKQPEMEVVKEGDHVALVPKAALQQVERKAIIPALVALCVHLVSFAPLTILNSSPRAYLSVGFYLVAALTVALPAQLAASLTGAPSQRVQLLQCFSLLLLGATLSTLATLNFSLALVIGLCCSPLSFVRPLPPLSPKSSSFAPKLALYAVVTSSFLAVSPPAVLYGLHVYLNGWKSPIGVLLWEMAKGWAAQGAWTNLFVWVLWWPAWVIGGAVLWSDAFRTGGR